MKRTWKNESVKKLMQNNSDYGSTDPLEIIRQKARDLVLSGFNLGWQGPPFNPIELAQLLKIEISPNESVPDARIVPLGKSKNRIEYNPYQRESRINFSIAHEIGHTLFSDCNEQIRNREESKTSDIWELEFLCDIAASEILLPYAQFVQEANSVKLNLDSILSIANSYKASIESVFLRFCEVVDKPCAMIVASFTDDEQTSLRVDYFKGSRQSNLKIDSGFIIPQDSKANECLNSGWTSHNIEDWEVFATEAHYVYSIGLPPLKKQKLQRVGIFLVPEYSPKSKDGEIYSVFGDATKPRGEGKKIIVQVLNTSGGLGFGFGKSMAMNWPASKKAAVAWKEDKTTYKLGGTKLTQLSDDTYVFQMIAQEGLFEKKGIIPLKYDVLQKCMVFLAQEAQQMGASIHMPQIGAGQAKGDWNIIQGIIHDELSVKGINVSVYILPGTKVNTKKPKANLTLFDETTLHEKK